MSTASSQKVETSSISKISVSLRPASKPGAVLAYGDVLIEFGSSKLEIFGVSIVKHDPDKPAWMSYPQHAGKSGKKFYPVVRIFGSLHDRICAEVLAKFERTSAAEPDAESARISDEDIPF